MPSFKLPVYVIVSVFIIKSWTLKFNPLQHRLKISNSLRMATSFDTPDFLNALGVMPLCLRATSKTTTIDDPTAGMTSDEIQKYLDNVGGGMCGYPDSIRTVIGLGLNISLLLFGIFTFTYGKS